VLCETKHAETTDGVSVTHLHVMHGPADCVDKRWSRAVHMLQTVGHDPHSTKRLLMQISMQCTCCTSTSARRVTV